MQYAVEEFHRKHGAPVGEWFAPAALDEERAKLRRDLLAEEIEEFWGACVEGDLAQQAKELGDLLYIVLGGFVEIGVDVERVFWAIHGSNMTKDGVPREDGKVTKGPGYLLPNIEGVIEQQVEHLRAGHVGASCGNVRPSG